MGIEKQRLSGTVQILQMEPQNYKAFGPYWWCVKRFLRDHYGPAVVYGLKGYEDADACQAIMEHHNNDQETIWQAACEHYAQQMQLGMPEGASQLPDGSTYVVYDPDMLV